LHLTGGRKRAVGTLCFPAASPGQPPTFAQDCAQAVARLPVAASPPHPDLHGRGCTPDPATDMRALAAPHPGMGFLKVKDNGP